MRNQSLLDQSASSDCKFQLCCLAFQVDGMAASEMAAPCHETVLGNAYLFYQAVSAGVLSDVIS